MVGGGSGGHITPLLAIARQLKRKHPYCKISVISERMGGFNHLFEEPTDDFYKIYYINAGKYRRYHGEKWFNALLDVRTMLLNIRDIFKLIVGITESFWLLLKIRPNVVFIKGGYVGVPVGLASRLLRIPYVTHDSDALPGLTNRMIAKKAKANAVGMPAAHYPYPKQKIVYVGIPVTEDFLEISETLRAQKRKDLELAASDFLLLITGGSNGAQRLDKIAHASLEKLLERNPKLNIAHQVGKDNEEIYADYPVHLHSRIRVAKFFKPLSAYLSAADAVIARAGATAITEIGMQKKPLIIVPNPYLSGGHQLKNAHVYQTKKAALVVNEHQALKDPALLSAAVAKIIDSPDFAVSMADNLYALMKKNSADKISELLINIARKKGISS